MNFRGDLVNGGKHVHHHYPKEPTAPKFLLPKPPANFTGRATALEWLCHNLHPGRVLTIHGPGGLGKTPVPLPALQAALGVTEQSLEKWVNELINYSLLERMENGRVQLIHALIYQWVRESGPIEAEVLTRLAEYWTEQGKAAEKQGTEGFAPLHGLTPHWLELTKLASQHNLPQLAFDL